MAACLFLRERDIKGWDERLGEPEGEDEFGSGHEELGGVSD